jgi:hypothetical protein
LNVPRHDSVVSQLSVTANKTGVKPVDDWQCPARDRPQVADSTSDGDGRPLTQWSPSHVHGAAAGSSLLRRIKDTDKADADFDAADDADGVGGHLAVQLLLITLGCLAVMLIVVGLVSYCRAVGS